MANILVVDDDKKLTLLVRGFLEKEKYQVAEAYSGRMALDAIKETKPDLIILDIMMPEMDGIEACKRIKADKDTKMIPIIMLTSMSTVRDKVIGLNAGANDYITKPFNPEELIARVKAQLRIKFLEAELLRKEEVEAVVKMGITTAHEINNPLTVIIGNLELLLMKKENLSEEDSTNLNSILESAIRIKEIVSKMINITRVVETEYAQGKKMIDIWKSG
ncbi:MAG: response regulator [Nitrospinae bacterium]|nr:response regulator [Nitrospinota bacterium]